MLALIVHHILMILAHTAVHKVQRLGFDFTQGVSTREVIQTRNEQQHFIRNKRAFAHALKPSPATARLLLTA